MLQLDLSAAKRMSFDLNKIYDDINAYMVYSITDEALTRQNV